MVFKKECPAEMIAQVAGELAVKEWQIRALYQLFASDATVPFIARYRKEATGGLDELQIKSVEEMFSKYFELEKRREAIKTSLVERELLTEELAGSLNNALTLAELEDIYLPYKVKRRTRATIAREKGLEPLAELILGQQKSIVLEQEAQKYIADDKGVLSGADALKGAGDIIAEVVSENRRVREDLRSLFRVRGLVSSRVIKKKKEEGSKFKDYFSWQEEVRNAASHRLLALFRGENEGVLRLKFRPDSTEAEGILFRRFLTDGCRCRDYLREVLQDSYARLLAPSLENELRTQLKEEADREAVAVFSENLQELLMAPPLGSRRMLGIDPGIRTGCKVVCLNEQGDLLNNTVIFPDRKKEQAGKIVRELVQKYAVEAIAIGNGTYGRETEAFIRNLGFDGVEVALVSESGASIYSASELAREEFPDYDLTVRGAVSIARRLMDPLAELVKLDPKSIGVGQYQHDVDQGMLKNALDSVVASCVNRVGVELNTASRELLTYVSGLGKKLAENIISYRTVNGEFKSRKELLKVSRLGAKAFEQAAGFIRVAASDNALDRSAVHPESYGIVERMAADQGCSVADLLANAEFRGKVVVRQYVTEEVGLPTLEDIMSELEKPGRDPREKFSSFAFSSEVNEPGDLQVGMELPGIVTNVTKFGAFVDVGVHQDGLVHISELADRFVKDPTEVVKVQQQVRVRVLEVDLQRRRIGLSMRAK